MVMCIYIFAFTDYSPNLCIHCIRTITTVCCVDCRYCIRVWLDKGYFINSTAPSTKLGGDTHKVSSSWQQWVRVRVRTPWALQWRGWLPSPAWCAPLTGRAGPGCWGRPSAAMMRWWRCCSHTGQLGGGHSQGQHASHVDSLGEQTEHLQDSPREGGQCSPRPALWRHHTTDEGGRERQWWDRNVAD